MDWPWIIKRLVTTLLIALFIWAFHHYTLRRRSKVIIKSDGSLVLTYPFLELVLGVIGFLFWSFCSYGAWHATPERSGGIKTAIIFYTFSALSLFLIFRYFYIQLYLDNNEILRRTFGYSHRLAWKQLHKISMRWDGGLLLKGKNSETIKVTGHLEGFGRFADAILLHIPDSATITSPASLVILESCTLDSDTLQYQYSRLFGLEERKLKSDIPQEQIAIDFGLDFAVRIHNRCGLIKPFFVNREPDQSLKICYEIITEIDYLSFRFELDKEKIPLTLIVERNGTVLNKLVVSELYGIINIE